MYTQPFPCLRTGTTMHSGKDVHWVWRDAGQWKLWTRDVWDYGHSGASSGPLLCSSGGKRWCHLLTDLKHLGQVPLDNLNTVFSSDQLMEPVTFHSKYLSIPKCFVSVGKASNKQMVRMTFSIAGLPSHIRLCRSNQLGNTIMQASSPSVFFHFTVCILGTSGWSWK